METKNDFSPSFCSVPFSASRRRGSPVAVRIRSHVAGVSNVHSPVSPFSRRASVSADFNAKKTDDPKNKGGSPVWRKRSVFVPNGQKTDVLTDTLRAVDGSQMSSLLVLRLQERDIEFSRSIQRGRNLVGTWWKGSAVSDR